MWFVDSAHITVTAGDGGRGCVAFSHPPYTRYPFPDGGDGGDGGDVLICTDPNLATLLDFQYRHEFHAGRGGHGGSNQKTGCRGTECRIRVPLGTVVKEAATGQVIRDLTQAGDEVSVAHGGRGGLGNANRKLSRAVRHSPQLNVAQGDPGEAAELLLELKLIADVGISGFPNAGKSSLLARISTAHPTIAPYPFTTLYPVLGVVQVGREGSFVACDIPGLIEGAHEGRGLGLQFLRHVERTRLLIHLIDLAGVDGREPLEVFHQLNKELSAYSPLLQQKPQVIVANKMDLPEAKARLRQFEKAVKQKVWPISCATGIGIPAMLKAVWKTVRHG